jgi:beta-glucosidase
MYPFGHGLSYTSFSYEGFTLTGGETITATFRVTNTGNREGADVPQVYLTDTAGDRRVRLLGFERLELKPGESRQVALKADPRLLARFDGTKGQWRIEPGTYIVALSRSAVEPVESGRTELEGRWFGR